MDELERLRSALPDRYRVEREIGRGGMAAVYLAHDSKYDRKVAIKVLDPELATMVGAERFLREIQIEARLQHINILPVHDSGESGGFVYFVMPYVEGESLRSRLEREKQLPIEDALGITREIAEALTYAHAHGVVHRDVKPENILMSEGHAVLADFGIARAIGVAAGVAAGKRVTKTGHSLGTPPYMSPEQASADDLDGRSDIYSLACVLYEMLGGEPPFTGRRPQAIIAKHMFEPPPPIHILRPSVPPTVESAIDKALSKSPADRFTTACEFAVALQQTQPAAVDVAPTADAEAVTPVPGAEEAVVPVPVSRWPAWLAKLGSRRALGFAVTAIVALLAGRFLLQGPFGSGDLDPSRVVVYPLSVTPQNSAALGEDIATLIGHELEGTGKLGWIDGWYILDDAQLAGLQPFSQRSARSTARAKRAAFFVVGRVSLRENEAAILLELHDVEGDSIRVRGSAGGQKDGAWMQRQTREALRPLLAALLPDEQPEPAALSGTAQATEHFLRGERAYRRARFAQALNHYKAAVAADSQFAIAAIKGARAAFWTRETDQAGALIRVALKDRMSLTPLQRHFASGLEDYLYGRADSAIAHFRLAFDIAPEWWVRARLGEVYTHMLPRESPLDSLAEAEFIEVHSNDPGLHPVLFHLIEFALRKGQVEQAEGLLEQYRAAEPDSARLAAAELMVDCVKSTPDSIDWPQLVLTRLPAVYEAAQSLTRGARQAECASAAWTATLTWARAGSEFQDLHFGALLGLQSLLVAQAQNEEAKRLLHASEERYRGAIGDIFLLNTVAGAEMRTEALPGVEELRRSFREGRELPTLYLWFLGIWEAHEGRADAAREVADSVDARAARSGFRQDRLLSAGLAAHATLAAGDSTRALELFRELTPTKPAGEAWYPWESLGYEQLTLARLLYARGEYAEALRIAANLDAPARPALELIYLPASLELRMRAARALGDGEMEERCERRLAALGRDDLIQSALSP